MTVPGLIVDCLIGNCFVCIFCFILYLKGFLFFKEFARSVVLDVKKQKAVQRILIDCLPFPQIFTANNLPRTKPVAVFKRFL